MPTTPGATAGRKGTGCTRSRRVLAVERACLESGERGFLHRRLDVAPFAIQAIELGRER